MPGGAAVERIAADANVILSSLVGKAALRVFTRSTLEVVSTRATLDEVREYLPVMAEAYGIGLELLEGRLRLLGVREYDRAEYQKSLRSAARRIAARDPDDVELLALALALDIPVWSNDSDFERTGVKWFTTARLLKELGV